MFIAAGLQIRQNILGVKDVQAANDKDVQAANDKNVQADLQSD